MNIIKFKFELIFSQRRKSKSEWIPFSYLQIKTNITKTHYFFPGVTLKNEGWSTILPKSIHSIQAMVLGLTLLC